MVAVTPLFQKLAPRSSVSVPETEWQDLQVIAAPPHDALLPPWQVMLLQVSPALVKLPIFPPVVISTVVLMCPPAVRRLPAALIVAAWQSTHCVFAVASDELTCAEWLFRASSDVVTCSV